MNIKLIQSAAILLVGIGVGCTTDDGALRKPSHSSSQADGIERSSWDFADDEFGVYFQLPPGWSFLPDSFVTSVVDAVAGEGSTKAHFGAICDATRTLSYPESILVFSPAASDSAEPAPSPDLEQLCRGPLVESLDPGSRPDDDYVLLGGEKFCYVEPDPISGLNGFLFVGLSRGRAILVMTFAPTDPFKTRVGEALSNLQFEQ